MDSRSKLQIGGERYVVERLLGEGKCSRTWLIRTIEPRTRCSLRCLKRTRCPFGDVAQVARAMRELELLRSLQGKRTPEVLAAQVEQLTDGTRLVELVFPYYPSGTLQSLVQIARYGGNPTSERELVRLCIEVAKGLQYLHEPPKRSDIDFPDDAAECWTTVSLPLSKHTIVGTDDGSVYIHMNLNPSNILISDSGIPLISGFTRVRHIKENLTSSEVIEWQEDLQDLYILAFVSPELADINVHSDFNCQTDIWSYGSICYALMFGMSPMENEMLQRSQALLKIVKEGNWSTPAQFRGYSKALLDIVFSCLQKEPFNRPTVTQLINGLQSLQDRQ